jgi:hypothetical protein
MFHAMTLVMQVKLHIHEEGNKWPHIKFFPLLRNKRIDDLGNTNAPNNITLRRATYSPVWSSQLRPFATE